MNRFSNSFGQADAAFNANYSEKLNQLRKDAQMVPAIEKQAYEDVIKVVEQATQTNMAKAELCAKIKKLGAVAIGIAKKYFGLPL